MARTRVPVTRTSRLVVFNPAATVAGDTVNGHDLINDGATMLWVRSAAGTDQTVSTVIVETIDGMTPPPVVLTIPANSPGALLGPFPTDIYGSVLEFDVSSASFTMLAYSLL